MSLKRKATDAATEVAKKSKANASITSFFGKPANGPSSSPADSSEPPTPKFDKAAWITTLTNEQKSLLDLEITTLHDSWLAVLHSDLLTTSFLSLKRFLAAEASAGKTVYPPQADIYAWSRHTPLPTVRAVILGQDPYHNAGQAHGLCFSVRPPTKAPPSLRNMYIALKKDYPAFKAPPADTGLLTPWAERGVLLLNTCLTVRAHEANSHANHGWETFTQHVIDVVNTRRTRGVVFLAWGSPAQKRCTRVNASRHLVLKSVHPSPLSAHKGFFDAGHFRKANEWLVERYGEGGGIDWDLGAKSEEVKLPQKVNAPEKMDVPEQEAPEDKASGEDASEAKAVEATATEDRVTQEELLEVAEFEADLSEDVDGEEEAKV